MTERPILFSAAMVRALLDGRKTQTRRILRPQPPAECSIHYMLGNESWLSEEDRTPLRHLWEAWGGPLFKMRPEGHLCGSFTAKMKFKPGDRLWVRERLECANGEAIGYPADGTWFPNDCWRWARKSLPSIHMPRAYSRLTLTVTEVRVQRLQDISEDDARAEGVECDSDGWRDYLMPATQCCASAKDSYRTLWDSINGAGSWGSNPWSAAYTFTVERRNIDASSQGGQPDV